MVEPGLTCFPLTSFLRLRFAAGAPSFNPPMSPYPPGSGLNPAGTETKALPPLSVNLGWNLSLPRPPATSPHHAGTARGDRCWFQAPAASLKTRISCFGVYSDCSKSKSALTLPP